MAKLMRVPLYVWGRVVSGSATAAKASTRIAAGKEPEILDPGRPPYLQEVNSADAAAALAVPGVPEVSNSRKLEFFKNEALEKKEALEWATKAANAAWLKDGYSAHLIMVDADV
jgi:hypothetical protein